MDNKIKILILGATGMVGNMMEKVLSTDNSFEIGLSTRKGQEASFLGKGYHIYELDVLKDAPFYANNYDYIINCIGITPESNALSDELVRVNTLFPINLAKNCKKSKIINITTNDVFHEVRLDEENEISADFIRNFYTKTKLLGEVSAHNVLNLRCSLIGPERFGRSKSFFEKAISDDSMIHFTDGPWNGITTYHLALIIKGIIKDDLFCSGFQHIIPYGSITKEDALNIICDFNWGHGIKENNRVLRKNSYENTKELSTINSLTNFLFWKSAGYSTPIDFISMMCELNKIYWRFGYAEERGFKKG